MNYFDYKKARPTPWGKADQNDKHGPFSLIGTPGHGGILIGKKQAEKYLSKKAIALGTPWSKFLAYEEDCQASIVFYERPEFFEGVFYKGETEKHNADSLKESAKGTIERWYPEYFKETETT